jgi:uncharacterized protein (TIGR02594 family)
MNGPIAEATKDGTVYGIGSHGLVVTKIQQALIASGSTLTADGDFGKITASAIKVFQARHKLDVDGWVGTRTAVWLDKYLDEAQAPLPKPTSVLAAAPWLAEMRAITGVKEFPGRPSNPIIMDWRSDIGRAFPDLARYAATYSGDAIPWCGFGLAGCFARAGVRPPNKFMWAATWGNWGTRLAPTPGCVMVFRRRGGGHVALLEQLDGDYAYIRGCNQSDMVNIVRHSMDSFTAATWPQGWPVTAIAGDISNATASGKEA